MKINKKIIFGMFFLLGILLISFVSADYKTSNPNYGLFDSYVGNSVKFDSSMCAKGQDFIVQIAPFGCEPAVVRSDLLEDQNVPIFCQLAATQINPLIDVEAIESISFTDKDFSRDLITDVAFHPAKAALGVKNDLNSPILNNIGYVVIVLKKQQNSSSMPEYVEGTLTARLNYDIENAMGIGKASFYLPQTTDDEWDKDYLKYSFWNGKGYLRAESVGDDGAVISVYDDTRQISRVSLEEGETSEEIYLSGFDCLAGLNIKLDKFEAPTTRARLKVGSDIVEVKKGERFLENRCKFENYKKQGLVESVKFSCKEDEGINHYTILISPRVRLDFERSNEEGYEVGDFLYESNDNRFVYLGYVGITKEDKPYLNLVSMPKKTGDRLEDSVISSFADLASAFESKRVTGVGLADFLINSGKFYVGAATLLYKDIFKGEYFKEIGYSKEVENLFGKDVLFKGFADAQNSELEDREYYDNALEDFDMLINTYPTEEYPVDLTYGEEALYRKIELAQKAGQNKDLILFCNDFKSSYPHSERDLRKICDDESKLSSSESSSVSVFINNRYPTLSFDGIY